MYLCVARRKDRATVVECKVLGIGARPAREFNRVQALRLSVGWGQVNIASVHLPSSKTHPKADMDIMNAYRKLTRLVAGSHGAFGIIIGDPNEKQQSRMGLPASFGIPPQEEPTP